jgi:hypothetical protein
MTRITLTMAALLAGTALGWGCLATQQYFEGTGNVAGSGGGTTTSSSFTTTSSSSTSMSTSTSSMLKKPGETCMGNSECTFPICLGGFCCSETCDSPDAGACSASATCSGDGGACQYTTDTCSESLCSGSTLTMNTQCDGNGKCAGGTPAACPNNLTCADGFSCNGSCGKDDTKCVPDSPGFYCDGIGMGTCQQKKGAGVSCAKNHECANDTCVDSYCCIDAQGSASPCNAPCFSCGLPNAEGTCASVPPGYEDTEPVNACAGQANCGSNGTNCACGGFGVGCVGKFGATCVTDADCLSKSCTGAPTKRCDKGLLNKPCSSTNDCISGLTCQNYTCST